MFSISPSSVSLSSLCPRASSSSCSLPPSLGLLFSASLQAKSHSERDAWLVCIASKRPPPPHACRYVYRPIHAQSDHLRTQHPRLCLSGCGRVSSRANACSPTDIVSARVHRSLSVYPIYGPGIPSVQICMDLSVRTPHSADRFVFLQLLLSVSLFFAEAGRGERLLACVISKEAESRGKSSSLPCKFPQLFICKVLSTSRLVLRVMLGAWIHTQRRTHVYMGRCALDGGFPSVYAAAMDKAGYLFLVVRRAAPPPLFCLMAVRAADVALISQAPRQEAKAFPCFLSSGTACLDLALFCVCIGSLSAACLFLFVFLAAQCVWLRDGDLLRDAELRIMRNEEIKTNQMVHVRSSSFSLSASLGAVRKCRLPLEANAGGTGPGRRTDSQRGAERQRETERQTTRRGTVCGVLSVYHCTTRRSFL